MPDRRLGLVFAGGGNRAFYQLGLMQVWQDVWAQTAAVAMCSAGACVVAMLLSGRAEATADFWKQRRAHVRRNINWLHPLVGKPLTPHAPIYRDTLDFCLAEGLRAPARAALSPAGPDFPPSCRTPAQGGDAGWAAGVQP